jgi:hypothetical protein
VQLVPHHKVIIYSLPESFNKELSKNLFSIAMGLVRKNKESVIYKSNIYTFTSLILRISNNATQLDCLIREVRYKMAKYRGRDKFSHSFKPKGKKVDEKLIESIKLNT